MNLLRSAGFLVVWIAAATAVAQIRQPSALDNCPVTTADQASFTPPESYRRPEAWGNSMRWYGTSLLWTKLPPDGRWQTTQDFLPKTVFREKLFWWREGYDPRTEPVPKLTVTAERLDSPRRKFNVGGVTNAIRADIPAMLVLIELPSPGCWRITGKYAESQLSYVVWLSAS
jgi:hypothetical protein